MEETTGAIPGGTHTHGVYNGYGYGYGYGNDYGRNGQDNTLVDLINKNDLNNSIREVGRAVDIASTQEVAGIAGLAKWQSDGTISTAGLITDLGRDVTNGVHNTMVQSLNSFNNLDKTLVNSTNQIISQGSATLAAMAECCCTIRSELQNGFCDIKTEARDNTDKITSLITANQLLDLQRQLNDSKSESSNLKQTATILEAIRNGNGNGNGGSH